MSLARSLWLVLVIVAADAILKHEVVQPALSNHYRTSGWEKSTAFLLLIPIFVLVYIPVFRFAAALMVAGSIGNLSSSLLIGYIPNSFAWTHGDTITYFNFADLTLLIGLPAFLIAFAPIVWKQANALRQAS